MIDLVNFDAKVFSVPESPRILMHENGDYYLNKTKIDHEAELIYKIDTKPSMMNVGKIVGPNTIYCLREIMPFVDIKPDNDKQHEELKTMGVDDVFMWK